MTEIEVFQFPATGDRLRALGTPEEPRFVAADICAVLDIGRVHDAVRGLDDDEKGTETIRTPGGLQPVTVVNEPGLYSLILRSRKPEAKAFKRWIIHDVLPAIRRTGRYEVATLGDPLAELERQTQLTTRAIELAKAERAARVAAEERAAELEPDAARARQTIDAHGLSLVGTVAKRFGIRESALREFLYAEGLLIRGGSRHNEPMARYVQSGHFEVKVRRIEIDPDRPAQTKSTTFVTQKGEALIWKRLYEAGYVTTRTMPAQQLELV